MPKSTLRSRLSAETFQRAATIRAEAAQVEREAMLIYAQANRIIYGKVRKIKKDSSADRIVRSLWTATRPMPPMDIARKSKVPLTQVRAMLSSLVGDGLVINLQEGYEACRSLHL